MIMTSQAMEKEKGVEMLGAKIIAKTLKSLQKKELAIFVQEMSKVLDMQP